MEPLFPIVPPCIFLYKPLRVGKARDNIKEVDAVPLHIALSLRFIPFIPHGLLYGQIVCTVNLLLILYMPSWCQPSSV
jgi:hypothetical protein